MKPNTVLIELRRQYGPVKWRPRYDPVSELIFTVLSQHTSDLNAERAYGELRKQFISWEAVVNATPQAISESIRVGGLSRIKGPRIRDILREIQRIRGNLDLSFLATLPLEEAKNWLQCLPGIGPKSAAVVLCFSLGMPALPVDTHVHRVAKRLGLIEEKTTAGAFG